MPDDAPAQAPRPTASGLGELADVDLAGVARGILGDEFQIQDADNALVGQGKQPLKTRCGNARVGKLNREEIDWPQFIVAWIRLLLVTWGVDHQLSFPPRGAS
ncbi:MAG TPA: hypothetical protein VGQ26_04580 [Streptosporangiaceae bacterium]|jgi:hypothetical protein|nr:hypothetical protein [Streptosporangiaceae bacterium]